MYLLLIARLVVKRYTTGTLGTHKGSEERILANTLPPNSKILQEPKKSTVYRVTSIVASSLSRLSASNSSAHPIAMATSSVLVTHSPLPLDLGLLAPIQPYASCNQIDIFPFPANTFLVMHINKTPPDAKHLSSNT